MKAGIHPGGWRQTTRLAVAWLLSLLAGCTASSPDPRSAGATPTPAAPPAVLEARGMARSGQGEQALATLRQALGAAPNDLHLHRAYQDQLRVLGRIAEGQQEYKARAAAEPRSVLARYLYGRSMILESPVEAELEFREAIELDAGFLWPYLGLGSASAVRGDHFQSVQVYERALERFPDSADLYLNLAEARGHIGALRNAIDAAQKSIALAPANARAYELCGLLQLKLGDVDGGKGNLQKALELDVSLGAGNLALAELALKQGDGERARAHAVRALAAGKELPPELRTLVEPPTGAGAGP